MEQTNAKASPAESRSFGDLEIAVWSFIAIFFEITCIRWLSCDVRALVFEQSLPLIACLTGLGSGLANKDDRPIKFFPITLLLFALSIKLAEFFGLADQRSASESGFEWQILSSGNEGSFIFVLLQFIGIILLLMLPFIVSFCIGSRLGALLSMEKPLKGYSLNAIASLFGCLAAYAVAFLAPDPIFSMAVVAAGSIYILIGKQTKWKTKLFCFIPVLFIFPLMHFLRVDYPKVAFPPNLINHGSSTQTIWSSYQRIDLDKLYDGPPPPAPSKEIGMVVRLNKVVDQVFFDPSLEVDQLPADLTKICADRRRLDSMGFQFGPAEEVLILGSGLGQEITGAIKNGAKKIDLVEIDPALTRICKQVNASAPKEITINYICDDARHFLETSKRNYDLVLMSNLYAQSSNWGAAKLRQDAFCYTKEAFKTALSRLKDNGNLVIAYPVVYPWIGERIFRTLEFAAGRSPQVFQQSYRMASQIPTLFVLPSQAAEQGNSVLTAPKNWSQILVHPKSTTPILSDDWPYLYLLQSVFDLPFRTTVLLFLLAAFIGARKLVFDQSNKSHLASFSLGAAFTIIELQSIHQFAHYFGNTWLTTSFVIAGAIFTVLLANCFVIKGADFVQSNSKALYLAIALFLISNSLWSQTDLTRVFGSSAPFIALSLQFFPAFLGSTLFSARLKENNNLSAALAASTFGSLLAAVLQFLKLSFGIKSLSLIALVFYFAAFLTSRSQFAEKQRDI